MRGMVNNEPVVSQAQTKEYDENYTRVFGERKPAAEVRGRWIWDETQQKLVRPGEYSPPTRALDAPIITDRWYEGARTVDGEDIGSRRKRQDYMRAKDVVDANDFSPGYYDSLRREREQAYRRERRLDMVESYRAVRRPGTSNRLGDVNE